MKLEFYNQRTKKIKQREREREREREKTETICQQQKDPSRLIKKILQL